MNRTQFETNVSISLTGVFRKLSIMARRLIQTMGGKKSNQLLTSPLFHGSNLSNCSHAGPSNSSASRILNSDSDLYGHKTWDKPMSTIPMIKLLSEVNMGSIMEHQKYKEMKSELSKMRRKGITLGPLDIASLYILSSKELKVNLEILSLDALSPYSHYGPGYKGYAEIKEMKHCGTVKLGKFNKEDEASILQRFETLLAKTGLDKEALMEELFAANKGRINSWNEDFMLKRQLAGFYLMQGMKDGEQRLPMEVYTKLAVLLYSGRFTEEEDAAILAWVDKHGATRWAELARNLGRMYLNASSTIRNRYEELTGKAKGNKQGAFDSKEYAFLIREVMNVDPAAFEKPLEDNALVVLKRIASRMGRSNMGIYNVYAGTVHPTVRRHKLGTLEKEVRGELIQQVKENKWKLSADIKFDKLALLPQFEGHSSRSLLVLYNSMLGATMKKLKKGGTREVTIEEVEGMWNKSTKHVKHVNVVDKEQQIVQAYHSVKLELGIGKN